MSLFASRGVPAMEVFVLVSVSSLADDYIQSLGIGKVVAKVWVIAVVGVGGSPTFLPSGILPKAKSVCTSDVTRVSKAGV